MRTPRRMTLDSHAGSAVHLMSPARAVEVLPLDGDRLTSEQRATACDDVARGRGWLAATLGDADTRHTLFRHSLVTRRILVGLYDGRYAGFLTYTFRREGPVAPALRDFLRTYGAGALRPWISFHLAEARLRSRSFYICSMEVSRPLRNRGIGTALLMATAEIARGSGATDLELDVKLTNAKARALYERLGFRPLRHSWMTLRGIKVSMAQGYQRMARPIGPNASRSAP